MRVVRFAMAPDPRSQRNRSTISTGLASGAALLGAITYVGLVDPHRPGSLFPPCPFKLVTGWNCPACGGLRMVHDLLHGEITAALTDNVFLLVALPALALWILLRRRQGAAVFNTAAIVVIAVTTITWTVIRNIPGFPLVPTLLAG